jgi:hypothetical protein
MSSLWQTVKDQPLHVDILGKKKQCIKILGKKQLIKILGKKEQDEKLARHQPKYLSLL